MAAEDHVVTLTSVPKLMREVRVRLTTTGIEDLQLVGSYFYGRNPVAASAYASYAGQYDQFKVMGMRLTYCFPKSGAIAATGMNTTVWPNVAVFYYDNDSDQPVNTMSAATDYASASYSSCQGVTSYSLPSLPTAMANTASIAGGVNLSTEWIDCNYPTALYGGIGVQLDKTAVSTVMTLPKVEIILEYDVMFRGRR